MTDLDFTPAWARRAIWYQIFVERFADGDPHNNPDLQSLRGAWPHDLVEPWQTHPWTSDWYARQPYEQAHRRPIWFHLQRRRYGGDLQGVLERLDYLQDLGVNALYFNPLFAAPSSHKYDAATYHHIDPFFGPDPQGDLVLMQAEPPADPAAWVWTAADRLFLRLIREVHRRGMRLIVDGVFNHMGLRSWAFQDLLRRGQASPYREWFKILDWEHPSLHAPFNYRGWFDVDELPELNQDENGLVDGPRRYVFDITRRWMDPDGDGDPADGIDGWRLDVAFCIRHPFWKAWRRHVKAINPEAYLTAEIITEDDSRAYLQGDEFDAEMNYHWAFACSQFFLEQKQRLTASQFASRLEELRRRHPAGVAYGMQNLLDSHDTARLASHIVNRRDLHYGDWLGYGNFSRPEKNPAFDTRAPNAEERAIQKLMALFQMTDLGAPMIYYGDEAGLWGANDPDCRQPMLWPELRFAPQAVLPDGAPRPQPQPVAFDAGLHAWYRQLIHLRRSLPALQEGDCVTLLTDDAAGVYAFLRRLAGQQVAVALNNSGQPQRASLPLSGAWREHLSGAVYRAGQGGLDMPLAAYGGAVLEAV